VTPASRLPLAAAALAVAASTILLVVLAAIGAG